MFVCKLVIVSVLASKCVVRVLSLFNSARLSMILCSALAIFALYVAICSESGSVSKRRFNLQVSCSINSCECSIDC